MAQEPQLLDSDRDQPPNGTVAGASAHGDEATSAGALIPRDNAARLQFWLIISGFAMMFVASILMWVRFGPSMFVDLATAVMNCF